MWPKKPKYSGLKCVRVESIPFCGVSRVDCAAAFLYYQGLYRLGPHNSRGKQVEWSPTVHLHPSPQLTCMQSIEFYGQLGKISDNPRNHEQRGSNEGLSKSLLYRIYEEIITWPMHACCMWTLVLDSGSVCCGPVTTHFHAPCTSQTPLDWQSLNWTFQTQHSIFHFVSSIPYFCGNLRICSCPSFVLQ